MRILVVDDNVDLTQTITLLIQLFGYEARSCNDPTQAVAAALAYRPDVAILDIGMPQLDGYELCQLIRQTPELSSIKIAAQSGYGDAASREKSAEAGFDVHLLKPVAADELQSLLAGWKAETVGSSN